MLVIVFNREISYLKYFFFSLFSKYRKGSKLMIVYNRKISFLKYLPLSFFFKRRKRFFLSFSFFIFHWSLCEMDRDRKDRNISDFPIIGKFRI